MASAMSSMTVLLACTSHRGLNLQKAVVIHTYVQPDAHVDIAIAPRALQSWVVLSHSRATVPDPLRVFSPCSRNIADQPGTNNHYCALCSYDCTLVGDVKHAIHVRLSSAPFRCCSPPHSCPCSRSIPFSAHSNALTR